MLKRVEETLYLIHCKYCNYLSVTYRLQKWSQPMAQWNILHVMTKYGLVTIVNQIITIYFSAYPSFKYKSHTYVSHIHNKVIGLGLGQIKGQFCLLVSP